LRGGAFHALPQGLHAVAAAQVGVTGVMKKGLTTPRAESDVMKKGSKSTKLESGVMNNALKTPKLESDVMKNSLKTPKLESFVMKNSLKTPKGESGVSVIEREKSNMLGILNSTQGLHWSTSPQFSFVTLHTKQLQDWPLSVST
jgi:hypothetical protein